MKKCLFILLLIFTVFNGYCQVSNDQCLFRTTHTDANLIKCAPSIVQDSVTNPEGLNSDRIENITATSNNNCSGAISLTVGGACVNANNSGNGKTGLTPSCDGGSATREQWFCFQATASNNFVRARYISSTAIYFTPFIEVYGPFASCTGGCTPTAASELGCMQCNKTFNDLASITYNPGSYYLIQFVDYGGATGTRNSTYCISVLNTISCTTCTNTCGSIATYNSTTLPASWYAENPRFAEDPVVVAGVPTTQCFTFKANNTTDAIQMGSLSEGTAGVTAWTWTVYNTSCVAVSSGSIFGSMTATGLSCDTSYVLCMTFTAAGQWDSISPYVYNAASTCTVLPISLINFKATYNSDFNTVLLQWATATETDNKFFTIEKSLDGSNWVTAATVAGAGTSSTQKNYDATDESPYPGVSYYRLKQTDLDGYYTYPSSIVPLNIPAKYSVNIFPNPTSGNITLRYSTQSPDPVNIKITDISGKTISYYAIDQVQQGINNFEVATASLAPGMYFMQVSNPQKSFYLKFVKE